MACRRRRTAPCVGSWGHVAGSDAVGNALQHSKLTYLVFASGGRIEVDFRLIDAVVARERVYDPSDVAGAPHIS
ncbi:MAG TPA: hypothetical protein VF395_05355 [Polyangiaceae bacterium]